MSESIQVAVRVRPLNSSERDGNSKETLTTFGKVVSIQDMDQAFTYTAVYGTNSTQKEIFSKTVEPLLPNLFKGFNLTILAYGQTGSGKTYTMGTAGGMGNDAGIIIKSISHIFDTVNSSTDCEVNISVSFLELYMEEFRDLLAFATSSGGTNLDIREDASGNIVVPGLTEIAVSSTEEALSWLGQGSQFRKTGATAMNLVSSRSHAVFTIKVECKYSDGRQATLSKFSLVDLAGSERAKKTGSSGERMQEGIDINKGLLALGNVISALSEQKSRHIPYRDSKLTRLLQDSLGGNSHTLMIACVSPSPKNVQETLSTLRYATRALKIKNKPVVNADLKAAEISDLQNQLRTLRELLEQERMRKGRQACPPGHQRLITLVKQSIVEDTEGGVMGERIKNCSPMTKDHLRHIGIIFDTDDETDCDTFHSLSPTVFCGDDDSSPPDNISTAETEQGYEDHQAQLNLELQGLEFEIENKEAEMNSLANMSLIEYEEKCQTLQQQVEALQVQKSNLEKQLEELQGSNSKASAMLAEQRRQQIKELERKIMLQKKELGEIARLRLEKKKDTEKITFLNKDIQALKAAKVKLAKEIKKSAENFRSWKHNQEREVGRLKDAANRGKYQMDKLARQHARQHNVLQRKYEEAMASNKRLQATISNQRHNVTLSNTHRSMMQSNNSDKVTKWLAHEIEIEKSKANHKDTLVQLIAEKERLDKNKKALTNVKCWEEPATKRLRLKEISSIESQISIQSKRITELEKIVNLEYGDNNKNPMARWTSVSSLTEARIVMENLLQSYIQADRDLTAKTERMTEMEENLVNENKKLKDAIKKLQAEKSPKQEKGQEETQEPKKEPSGNEMSTPVNQNLAKLDPSKTFNLDSMVKSKRKTLFFANDYLLDDESDLDASNNDDIGKDPDWRKTPFQKQLRSKLSNNSEDSNLSKEKKVSVDGHKCKCSGACDTNRCGCKKNNGKCSENCVCNASLCQNRFKDTDKEDDDVQDMFNSTPLNTTFEIKKRNSSEVNEEVEEENLPVKRKKRMFSSMKLELNF